MTISLRKRDLLAGLAALPLGAVARATGGGVLPETNASEALLVGLFTALERTSIPARVQLVQTAGFLKPGRGAARYRRSAGLPTWGRGKWWNSDAAGAQWELAEDRPETDMFGTLGDAAVRSPAAGGPIASADALLATVSGTDVTQPIQDCVDYCLFKKLKFAMLSEGRHLTSAPVHLGYGESFSNVSLIGRGSCYAPWDLQFGGSVIIASHSNAPVIVFQGARDSHLESLTIYGLYANWVAANYLAASSRQPVRLDDTDITVWNSPALHPHQDTRYTPFAGVAIDPYSGERPAISYPDVSYPSWLGIRGQYGRKPSSGITLRDTTIIGAIAGIAIQPCDADANGDFVQLERVSVSYCKYMVTAGNAQGRNLGLYGCTYNSMHTLFEGRTHGRQVGRFQGTVDNLSGSSSIQLLNADAGYALPMSFRNCYFEGTWRIGNVVGSNAGSLLFSTTYFYFPMPVRDNGRGQPANHLSGSTTREIGVAACQAPVRFLGCKIAVESVLMLIAQDVSFDGEIRPTERDTGTIEKYAAYAHNGLAGGLVVWDFGDATDYAVGVSARYKQADGSTGRIGADISILENRFRCSRVARKYGAPIYARWLEPAAEGTAVTVRQKSLQREKSSLTRASRSRRTMILTESTAHGILQGAGADPGDVWIDRGTGSVLFVTSHDRASGRIILELQNNWKGKAGAEMTVQPIDFASGQFQCISTRLYTPDYPLLVDSKAHSPIFENAGTANGGIGALASGSPAVGDRLVIDNDEDNMIESGAAIVSIDAVQRTITMSVKANETRSRKRIGRFRAAPPANSTAP